MVDAGLMIGVAGCFAEATLASMHATGFSTVLIYNAESERRGEAHELGPRIAYRHYVNLVNQMFSGRLRRAEVKGE